MSPGRGVQYNLAHKGRSNIVSSSATTTVDFISHSVEQTIQVGALLGEVLQDGDVLCLSGDLGAGKTALTRGIAAGWGAREPVTSPTFTLVHEHTRAPDGQMLYHIDCYRIESPADAWSIGLEDMIYGEHVAVIEWAENVRDLLPPDCLWITLSFLGDSERRLSFRATGERARALLHAFRERTVGRQAGPGATKER